MNEMDKGFDQVVNIINQARENAFRKVNEELILMYQAVGKFLSERAKEAAYGDGYIDALSEYIQDRFPGIKGFNRRGLYRMKQFMLEIGKDFTFIDEEYAITVGGEDFRRFCC